MGSVFLLGYLWKSSLKWASLVFFLSSEKLQFLRNITCIRLNNDATAVLLARLENRHNNLIEVTTRCRATRKVSCEVYSPSVFFLWRVVRFCAVNSIYSLNDFIGCYVCCSRMCLYAGECFLNLTSKSEQIGRNIFIKCSLFISFDPLHCTKTANPEYNQLEQKQSAGMQLN